MYLKQSLYDTIDSYDLDISNNLKSISIVFAFETSPKMKSIIAYPKPQICSMPMHATNLTICRQSGILLLARIFFG